MYILYLLLDTISTNKLNKQGTLFYTTPSLLDISSYFPLFLFIAPNMDVKYRDK